MAVIALAAIIYVIFRATSYEKKKTEHTIENIKKIYEPSQEQLSYSVKTEKTRKSDKQTENELQNQRRKELKKKEETDIDINVKADKN